MFFNRSIEEKYFLLDSVKDFLSSKKRKMPILARIFGSYWLKWRAKETEQMLFFLREFNPRYLKEDLHLRIDPVVLARELYDLMIEQRRLVRKEYEVHESCDSNFDVEYYIFICDTDGFLQDLVLSCSLDHVKYFLINKIIDLGVLATLMKADDEKISQMAKDRVRKIEKLKDNLVNA